MGKGCRATATLRAWDAWQHHPKVGLSGLIGVTSPTQTVTLDSLHLLMPRPSKGCECLEGNSPQRGCFKPERGTKLLFPFAVVTCLVFGACLGICCEKELNGNNS